LQGDRGGCGRIGHDDQKAQICAVTGTNTKLQIANAFANLFKTKPPKNSPATGVSPLKNMLLQNEKVLRQINSVCKKNREM
jgi:hypothetical protein